MDGWMDGFMMCIFASMFWRWLPGLPEPPSLPQPPDNDNDDVGAVRGWQEDGRVVCACVRVGVVPLCS